MRILTIDIGGSAIKSAIFYNEILTEEKEVTSNGLLGAMHVLDNLFHLIDSYKDFNAIGICTTGQVDPATGAIVCENENIPGYGGLELGKIVSDKYKKPVFVENDVNAAALGEANFGAGKSIKDFLCLTYGTGIGGAIMINNRLLRGSKGFAGEVGHMITHANGERCNCGSRGCYETYASTTALVELCKQHNGSLTNGHLIFEEVNNNNQEITQLVDQWIHEIIYGLINLIHVFNPSHIILGGGIMQQEYIINKMKQLLPSFTMDGFGDLALIPAKLKNQAGQYGMAAIVLSHFESVNFEKSL